MVPFLTALVRSETREIPEVHVIERIREQIVPERKGEQIRKIPVPPIVEEIVKVVQVVLHEHLQQRNVEPQIQEQIVGNVQALPRELFPERVDKRILDFPVPPMANEIPEVVTSSHNAAHTTSTPVNKCVAPARDVALHFCATGCGWDFRNCMRKRTS